jgi:translation initiation factor 2 subunit 3
MDILNNYDEFIKQTMQNQPLINIGVIGHVANGKSTMVGDIAKEETQRHSKEKEKNITIKLGYANAKIYKCPSCSKPECYQSEQSGVFSHLCNLCGSECELVNHVSFVDCPGHYLLMQTMLNGTCVMNYTILVESANNDKIPELQTMEHFEIAQEAQIPTSFICLNKLDLMMKNKNKVPDIIERLEEFSQSYGEGKKIPVIPISGTHNINIDVVLEYITKMQIPQKNLTKDFKMLVIRSFNVNKEKTQIKDLKGGVIGGSLLTGMININDDVVIFPGYARKSFEKNTDNSGKTWKVYPLKSKALSINSGKNSLTYAVAGGLIGVQLDIDPYFTGDDRMTGNVIYNLNAENKEKLKNVKVYEEITLKYKKLTRKLTEYITEYTRKFDIRDKIQINVNSNNISSRIKNITKESIELILEKPICIDIGEMVTISKINDNSHIDIFGKGIFESGIECDIYFENI